MSESNWTYITNSLSAANVARGVSLGFTPPNGGGTFVFGYRSLTSVAGCVAKAGNGSNFFPIAAGKGCSVSGAIQRNGSQYGTTMLFGLLQSNDVGADAYMLGLTQDEEPSHIVLAKGTLSDGLISTATNILRTSVSTIAQGTWVQLRLDCIVQPNGDVCLQVFQNDLASHAVGTPTWDAIDGMTEFVDDVLGVNSGTVPYDGGYCGDAYITEAIGRYALNDYMVIARQL